MTLKELAIGTIFQFKYRPNVTAHYIRTIFGMLPIWPHGSYTYKVGYVQSMYGQEESEVTVLKVEEEAARHGKRLSFFR